MVPMTPMLAPRSRPLWIVCVLLFVGPLGAEDAAAPSAEGLFRRGEELAGDGRIAEALRAWRDAYLEKLPRMRGLSFRYPVLADVQDREALRSRLLVEIDKEYPEEKVAADVAALSTFGFFGPDLDLRSILLRLLTQEIAGYYDPESKQLYLVLPEPRKPKWWEKALGRTSGIDPDEWKGVLSHEMSHALMDQHFDLYSLHQSVKHDDDMALALNALVEGEAMVAMLAEMGGSGGGSILDADPDFLAGYFKAVMPLAASWAGGSAFRDAPLILRESLLFPYIQGLVFCVRVAGGRGPGRIDDAFRRPPVSTEQILHPEKYALVASGGGDEPQDFVFSDSVPLPFEEWELVNENVLGELQVEILLRPGLGSAVSVPAAAGWDGDRFRVWRRKGDPSRRCLVWATVWDSERDAGEFSDAIEKHFRSLAPSDGAERLVVAVARDRVFVVRGCVDEPLADALESWARTARTVEKKAEIRRFETPVRFSDGGLVRDF